MRLLDGTKIEMDKYYSVVTNDFMADGGDNYDFTGATDIVDTQKPVRDALMVKFRELGNISFKFNENTLIDGQDSIISEDSINDDNSGAKPEAGEDSNNSSNTTKPNSGLGNLPHTGVPALAGLVALIGVGFIVVGKKMNKDDENNAS